MFDCSVNVIIFKALVNPSKLAISHGYFCSMLGPTSINVNVSMLANVNVLNGRWAVL